MANTKNLPNIVGTETIASSWRKLLDRDRNISTMFAGTDFTTDQTVSDIGRPNYRVDLNRLFFWDGEKFVDLFDTIGLDMFTYETDNPDIPEGVNDLKGVLDAIIRRNVLNAVTLPAEGVKYVATGTDYTFALPRATTNKYSLFIFIDGVKQETSTYDLSEDGKSILFKVAPARGELVEIIEHSSLTEWDYSPNIQYFKGDGSKDTFDLDFEVLRPELVSVNVDGVELQKNQFSVPTPTQITLNNIPANNANIQVTSLGRASLLTVSPNSIGTDELKAGSVTKSKLADGILFNINMIENGDISSAMLANNSVTSNKLANNSVSTAKIIDKAVTEDKLSTAVQNKLNSGGADLSGYYTKTEIDNKGYLTQHQSLADYYTKTEIDNKGYLTQHQSLADYYTKTEVDDMIGDIDVALASIIAG